MLLDKDSIVNTLKDLSLPIDSYWVIMGAALVLYGVRESTHDIDLGCNNELFQRLIDNGHTVRQSRSGKDKIELADNVHIYREWLVESVTYTDGIPIADLDSIVRDKSIFGRRKDIDDIQLIRRFRKEKHLVV